MRSRAPAAAAKLGETRNDEARGTAVAARWSMKERLTGWRKIATAVWDGPNDPQIYGALELDAGPVLDLVERARAAGHHLTATHLVGRAVAHALSEVPELNVRLVGDRAIARERVDVFFITAVAKGRDLTGVKIVGADRRSAVEIAAELAERAGRMKRGDDPDFARAKRAMEMLPRPLLRLALRFGAWLAGDHDVDVPALGISASPFGSAMVTSVGMFGLPMGFAPLAWVYRVPVIVLIGEIAERPVARSGRVEVRPVLPLSVTVDHRYVDGAQLGEALRAFRVYLERPAAFEPAFAAPRGASACEA